MPSGVISRTNCKECIFAIYNGDEQTGCEDSRIEKYGSDVVAAYDNEKKFFVIDRVCTLYRNSTWNSGLKDIKKAKEEVSATFDILIDCTKISEDMASYIKNLISKNNNLNTIKLFYYGEISKPQKNCINNIFYDNIDKIELSVTFDKIDYIYQKIAKSKNLFHIVIDENNYIDVDKFIDLINYTINEELKRGVIFKSNDKVAISNLACKLVFPYLYLDYDNNYPKMEQTIKDGNLYIEF